MSQAICSLSFQNFECLKQFAHFDRTIYRKRFLKKKKKFFQNPNFNNPRTPPFNNPGRAQDEAMEAARLIPYDLRNSNFTRKGWRFWAMTFAREKRRLVDFRWTSASESLFLIFLLFSSARLVFSKKCGEARTSRLKHSLLTISYI